MSNWLWATLIFTSLGVFALLTDIFLRFLRRDLPALLRSSWRGLLVGLLRRLDFDADPFGFWVRFVTFPNFIIFYQIKNLNTKT